MTRKSDENILARRKATSSMVRADTSLKKVDPTTKANGETTRWKAKAKLISKRASWNTQESGKPTSTMAGESFTRIPN